jgi:6,7-dimethyl-8-ribityllumazine synthase
MVRVIEGKLSAEGLSFGLVVSRFNGLVTKQLLDGAVDCLLRHGALEKDLTVVYCPGAFEIPQVALELANTGQHNGIICLGCVIRGETPHFEYIASHVTRGVGHVAMKTGVPVAFGVLTTDTLDQALERAGSKAGNKGWEAALTAVELVRVTTQLAGGRKKAKH